MVFLCDLMFIEYTRGVCQPYFIFCEILCKKLNGLKNAIPIFNITMWHDKLAYIVNNISMWFHSYWVYARGSLKPFLFFKKITKYEMVNINAITNPLVPIIYVTSKDTMLNPLVALRDKRRYTRCSVMWIKFHTSPETWKNVIILKIKVIIEYIKCCDGLRFIAIRMAYFVLLHCNYLIL